MIQVQAFVFRVDFLGQGLAESLDFFVVVEYLLAFSQGYLCLVLISQIC